MVKLAVTDLVRDVRVRERVSVILSEAKRPVQFELIENTPGSIAAWIKSAEMIGCRLKFPGRFTTVRISELAKKAGSCGIGWPRAGRNPGDKAAIRCAVPKPRRLTGRPEISEQFNYCSDTPR